MIIEFSIILHPAALVPASHGLKRHIKHSNASAIEIPVGDVLHYITVTVSTAVSHGEVLISVIAAARAVNDHIRHVRQVIDVEIPVSCGVGVTCHVDCPARIVVFAWI